MMTTGKKLTMEELATLTHGETILALIQTDDQEVPFQVALGRVKENDEGKLEFIASQVIANVCDEELALGVLEAYWAKMEAKGFDYQAVNLVDGIRVL